MGQWWQLEDLCCGRALATGLQEEALVLPPGYRSILLQVQHMEAQTMERDIVNEFLAVLPQWAPEGKVIHQHMVTDAGYNMLVALNAAGLEGIVCIAHK